jgi:hypothetical protein
LLGWLLRPVNTAGFSVPNTVICRISPETHGMQQEQNQKSRVAESLPKPEEAEHLSEEQKRQLELNARAEHEQGEPKEKTEEKAEELEPKKGQKQ